MLLALIPAAIIIATLVLTGSAIAQSNLPPEARARILIIDIDKALARKDEAGALAKLKELESAGVARPNALFITEAKLAARAKDYPRAKAALDKYFKAAGTTDSAYNEAAEIYSAIGDIEAKAKTDAAAMEAAGDTATWRAAMAANNCDAYVKYLDAQSRLKAWAGAALEAHRKLDCPALSPQLAHDARRQAGATDGKRFETAARNSGIAGRWITTRYNLPCDSTSVEVISIENGALVLANGIGRYSFYVKEASENSVITTDPNAYGGVMWGDVWWARKNDTLTMTMEAPTNKAWRDHNDANKLENVYRRADGREVYDKVYRRCGS